MSARVVADGPGTTEELAQSERLLNLPSRLLSLVAIHTDQVVNEGLASVGARKWHYAVLVTLRDFGPASQAALSRRTGIYRSDMVAVITELAEREYVRRSPDIADQRRNVITLTTRGHHQLRRLDTLIDRLQERVFAPLSSTELEQITQLLRRLLDHQVRAGPASQR